MFQYIIGGTLVLIGFVLLAAMSPILAVMVLIWLIVAGIKGGGGDGKNYDDYL